MIMNSRIHVESPIEVDRISPVHVYTETFSPSYPCKNLPNSNDLTKKEVTFLSIETR